MRFAFLFFYTVTSFNLCLAQSISPVFNTFNFENGLSSNQVLSLAQDDDGFLWVGTADGLNRYDGNSFKQYFKSAGNSIADNHINALAVLKNNIVAAGTANGLSFFNTHTGFFKTFRVEDSTAMFFMRNNFSILCTDKNGNLWAASQTDLYIFSAELKLKKIIPGIYTASDINKKIIQWVWLIKTLPDDNIVVSYSNSLKVYNTNTLQEISGDEHERSIYPSADCSLIYYTNNNITWYTKNRVDSIFSVNTKTGKRLSYPLYKNASASFAWFSKMFLYDDSTLYLHFADTGFFKLSFHANSSLLQHIDNLPPVNDVGIFLRDKQNNLWLGTAGMLYQLSPNKNQFKVVFFSKDDRSTADINNFLAVDDVLYASSYGKGLYAYNTVHKTYEHIIFSMPRTTMLNLVWSIRKQAKDTLWVATQEGLLWLNTRNKSYGRLLMPHPAMLDSFPVTTCFTDSRKNVWIGVGGGHGVVRYNSANNKFNVYDSQSQPAFPLRHPTAMDEDNNGNLWMGTQRGGGLVKWNRGTNAFTIVSAKAGTVFNDDRINSIYVDPDNRLWIATGNSGLLQYDIVKKSFKSFDKEKWSSHANIVSIDGKLYPSLWMTTSNGLVEMNTKTGSFQSFFKKDGLPDDDYEEGILYDSSTQNMYAGFSNGIVSFQPQHLLKNNFLPSVIINSVTAGDSLVKFNTNKPLQLGYKDNNITVDYTAVDLVNGSDLIFRYKLNSQPGWNVTERNRQIHFSNLAPGQYSLNIQVAGKNGVWNSKSTAINFYIIPPFWQTIWFYALIIVAVILSLYALYHFRMTQLRKLLAMRNRIAKDLHDDIGGTMTAMNFTNELAMQNLHQPSIAKQLLNTVADDLRNIGNTLDDIVWSVNPKNDSMEEIMARMRRHASRTWEEAGIEVNIRFDERAAKQSLNMEQRHDLYLAFKEAVTNVARHAKCSKASSSLLIQNNCIFLEISDNGTGFDTTASNNRNGLKNLHSRMQRWKGSCIINSTQNLGTIVQLTLPITQKGD